MGRRMKTTEDKPEKMERPDSITNILSRFEKQSTSPSHLQASVRDSSRRTTTARWFFMVWPKPFSKA